MYGSFAVTWLHRFDDFGRGMPDVQHGDAGREVDQAVAVDVFDDRARGARRDDRMQVRDARGHRLGPAGEPLLALRPRDLRDQLAFLWDVHARSVTPFDGSRRRSGGPCWPAPLYEMSKGAGRADRARPFDVPFRTIRIWP
jgi:hypothetical protein